MSKRTKPVPSLARVKDALSYDAETGHFTWILRTSIRVMPGRKAGGPSSDGYLRIGIDGVRYKAHVLALYLGTGVWPQDDVDHINGNKLDNRIENLRVVSNQINTQNQRRANADSMTGVLGVTQVRPGWYRAQISTNGRNKHLGVFNNPEMAHAAYVAAKRVMHEGCTL